jgi:FkbM family methyltransferase
MPAMAPEDFIKTLYRLALGRDADEGGLATWLAAMETSGDPSVVLHGLLNSEEFRLRSDPPGRPDHLLRKIAGEFAGETLTIIDVGAQKLASEDHVYSPLCRLGLPYRIIGFEPLSERLLERNEAEGKCPLVILPYAIADGSEHTLHVNNDDATSSIYPLDEAFCSSFEHIRTLRTVHSMLIETKRLDDAIGNVDEPIDFLKLDIQGAELAALMGAERTLNRTAVVHCEVEFSAIYKDQPLYPQIQAFLNSRGFEVIDILVSHRYSYEVPSNTRSADRLIWADAVFFRESRDARTRISQALTSWAVYGKTSLAEHLVTKSG